MRNTSSTFVFFVLDGNLYRLPEGQATSLGESLRRGAAQDLGDQGHEAAALAVANAIEDVLVGATDEPIALDLDRAAVIFHTLDSSPEAPRGDRHRLYKATREAQQDAEED